jgi:hypothetical protein
MSGDNLPIATCRLFEVAVMQVVACREMTDLAFRQQTGCRADEPWAIARLQSERGKTEKLDRCSKETSI